MNRMMFRLNLDSIPKKQGLATLLVIDIKAVMKSLLCRFLLDLNSASNMMAVMKFLLCTLLLDLNSASNMMAVMTSLLCTLMLDLPLHDLIKLERGIYLLGKVLLFVFSTSIGNTGAFLCFFTLSFQVVLFSARTFF